MVPALNRRDNPVPDLPPPIETYIRAYNALDVEAMLACLADDVRFENYTGDQLTAQASGKPSFEEMARFGVTAFSSRRQTVTNAITVADTTAVEIDYTAVVAQDLPNGWKAGQQLAFRGASCFRLRDGLIARIVDQS